MMVAKKKRGIASKARKPKGSAKKKELPIADGVPVFCSYDKIVDTKTLIPHPKNRNTHPKGQIDLLGKIISAQGWRNAIVVSNQTGYITKGHGRLLAAQDQGLVKCPVDYQDYADEATEWADLIADNKIAELAIMDNAALKDDLIELDTFNMDMDLTGFCQDELQDFICEVNDPPPDTESKNGLTPVSCPKCGHEFTIGLKQKGEADPPSRN